jgi:hypothetical protein
VTRGVHEAARVGPFRIGAHARRDAMSGVGRQRRVPPEHLEVDAAHRLERGRDSARHDDAPVAVVPTIATAWSIEAIERWGLPKNDELAMRRTSALTSGSSLITLPLRRASTSGSRITTVSF